MTRFGFGFQFSPVNSRIENQNLCSCRFSDENKEDDWEGPVSDTLPEPDVLYCPICVQPLTVPVYQCTNGHILCSSCCKKITSKICPSCNSHTLGQQRNIAIEKVIEIFRIACKYSKNGCKEMVQFSKMEEHFSRCRFGPKVECPLPYCNFAGSYRNWYDHISQSHETDQNWPDYGRSFSSLGTEFEFELEKTQKCLILQCLENEDHDLFVVSNFRCCHGNSITLYRAAPPSCVSPCFDIVAGNNGDFSKTVSLHSSAECIQEKVINPSSAKKTLFVQDGFNPDENLQLRVRIYLSSRGGFCGKRHPE